MHTPLRDRVAPRADWPDLDFSHPAYRYPDRLNAVTAFLDRWCVRAEDRARLAVCSPTIRLTYAQLHDSVARLAHVLTDDLGIAPGTGVLLRIANTPDWIIAFLAVLRLGAVAVPTLPALRTAELSRIIEAASIRFALCDATLLGDLHRAVEGATSAPLIGVFGAADGSGLEAAAAGKPASFPPYETAADDVGVVLFSSGTTGQPKGTVHVHRDLLAICDGFAHHCLQLRPDDLVCGTPPLSFAYGLGALAVWPLSAGAATLLLETPTPLLLAKAIQAHRPTVCFSSPKGWQWLSELAEVCDLRSLRIGVSAGEHLSAAMAQAVRSRIGIPLLDGLGATEMLGIFLVSRHAGDHQPAGAEPVPGYRVVVLGPDGTALPRGAQGRLAVKGPTGCRYLGDSDLQRTYVQNGWNITGDLVSSDDQGRIHYLGRWDDVILSGGYTIAPGEVEAALASHPSVSECAVVGVARRGLEAEVVAVIVPNAGIGATDEVAAELRRYANARLAPYKRPHRLLFRSALPKTSSGKPQRYLLRQELAASPADDPERAAEPGA